MLLTSWKDCQQLNMDFRQYLESEYLKWQQQQGGRRTVNEFADYLGVGQSTLSMWWNDERKPQGDNIRKLAQTDLTALQNWILHDDPTTVNRLLTALCERIEITPGYDLNIVWR